MSEVLKILEDLFSGAASSVKVLEGDPPGSLVYGTLVKHIEDPKTFGFVSESYRTDKKDINGKDVFYYNIITQNDGFFVKGPFGFRPNILNADPKY